jgi:aspartate aminotransferase
MLALARLSAPAKRTALSSLRAVASSTWSNVPMGPPDPILGLVEAFKLDTFKDKVNLSAGTYRDDNGKPWVLPSVRAAEEQIMAAALDHEYLPIVGDMEFVTAARRFALGADSPALVEKRVASVQSLSGTGACRLIGDFYTRFLGKGAPIYLPKPSWGNHANIFRDAGLEVRAYRYLDASGVGFDLDGMLEDLKAAPDGSAVLLHACAHNPTGVDPTPEQWVKICSVLKEKPGLSLFFDSAYQGFASGDAEADAFALRHFVQEGVPLALAQSFAKNFGLYGERVGVLSVVCNEEEEAARVLSQLKIIIRPMYSSPPTAGARIVKTVLSDAALEGAWRTECKTMADRIIAMRSALREEMAAAGSTRDWSHITNQIGMFCYTGLLPDQVDHLREEFHVYITRDGRISMAGINHANVKYVAKAMHAVSS